MVVNRENASISLQNIAKFGDESEKITLVAAKDQQR